MNVIVVNGTQARTFDGVEPFVTGQSNFDKVEFRFDNAWDGMTKVAQFVQGSNMYNVAVENNECICPSELVKGCVFVRVRGYSATDVIATASEIQIPVEQGFEPGGVPPVPPTPDLYSKLVAKVQMEVDAAKASADAAKADADRAAALAAEVAEKAAQTAQDASDAAKAMEAAQTAQRLAEEAHGAAETARTAAEAAQAAAEQSATDAAGAKQDAETAQKAAQDAAAAAAKALADIRTLYQEMQTWAQGVIQDVNAAGSAAVQSVQSAGDTQVQRVTDEGTTQTANAKAQADAATQSAAGAAQSAQEAAESAAVYDDVVADVNQLKQDLSDVNKIAEKAYIMTDARDNKKYGMEWGVNKDGYPTVTFQEVTE